MILKLPKIGHRTINFKILSIYLLTQLIFMRLVNAPPEKKKKLKEKLWLTKGLLKSIKLKKKCIKNFLVIQIILYILNTKIIVTLSIEY